MTNINVKINGTLATANASGKLTSGYVGLPVSFEFDDSWSGLKKAASFRVGSLVRTRYNIEESTTVPWEVMRNSGRPLEVGVEGRDENGNVVIPTVWASVSTILPGATAETPAAPNPDKEDYPGGGGGSVEGAVLYLEQDLTDAQKSQARTNIGAVDAAYVDREIAAFDIIKVVDALPEIGLPNRFYLVPKTEPDTQDLFDEYVWVNDAWEYTATKRLEVDLTGYVKNTDYATGSKAGVGKSSSVYGVFRSTTNNYWTIKPAISTEIAAKTDEYRPIVPKYLDRAVKEGICNNSIVLTEEEKAAARAWLGIE